MATTGCGPSSCGMGTTSAHAGSVRYDRDMRWWRGVEVEQERGGGPAHSRVPPPPAKEARRRRNCGGERHGSPTCERPGSAALHVLLTSCRVLCMC